jgi:hypothetical protein
MTRGSASLTSVDRIPGGVGARSGRTIKKTEKHFDVDNGWTIGPTFDVDFVDGVENKEVGIDMGKQF